MTSLLISVCLCLIVIVLSTLDHCQRFFVDFRTGSIISKRLTSVGLDDIMVTVTQALERIGTTRERRHAATKAL